MAYVVKKFWLSFENVGNTALKLHTPKLCSSITFYGVHLQIYRQPMFLSFTFILPLCHAYNCLCFSPTYKSRCLTKLSPKNLDVWQNSLGYFTMNRKCANSPGTALLSDIWTMASVTNKYQMSRCVCGNISCLNEMDSNQSSGKDLITRWLHFFQWLQDFGTQVFFWAFGVLLQGKIPEHFQGRLIG